MTDHRVTIAEHGADSRKLYVSCSCGWSEGKPVVGFTAAQRLGNDHIARKITRADLIGRECLLDFKRAIISGHEQAGFVTVATLPNGPSYTWSVVAAARIMANGGDFRS